MVIRVPVAEGKYEFVFDEESGKLTCDRYGEQWRVEDLIGDKAVLALVQELHDIRTNMTSVIKSEINKLLVKHALEEVKSATDGAMAEIHEEFMQLCREIIELKRVNRELQSENQSLNYRITQTI